MKELQRYELKEVWCAFDGIIEDKDGDFFDGSEPGEKGVFYDFTCGDECLLDMVQYESESEFIYWRVECPMCKSKSVESNSPEIAFYDYRKRVGINGHNKDHNGSTKLSGWSNPNPSFPNFIKQLGEL